MTTHVEGTKEQFKAFMEAPIEGPIRMLNMLKFKADGGAEKYAEYGKCTAPCLEKVDGKMIFRANGKMTVIGGEEWDLVFIIEYPSKDKMVEMITSEEYQAGAHLRHEALEDSRLVCMQTEEA